VTGLQDAQVGVAPGDVLAGKYRVERVLGAGGMGVVVAAHHIQLDERVALKFLLPEALESPEAIVRFIREARAAVKIKGDHVARVSDVGQLENGAPYIVMEYLDGIDLAGWLGERGPLAIELAVDFVLQTCEAIADAHALGIVHRDLKPANLFCVRRPDGQHVIKVLDFGISKYTAPGAAEHDMTRTNAMVGSPHYMSPEQMQSSKGVDARTDIWSLGIILFELMAGRTPFEAESITELAVKVSVEPAPRLGVFRADVAHELEHVVSTCLEKEPAGRYQTIADLAVALGPFGSREGRMSVQRVLGTLRQTATYDVPPPAALPPSGPSGTGSLVSGRGPNTAASWGTGSSSTRRAGRVAISLVAIAGLTVVVLAVAGALVLRTRTAAEHAPELPTAPSSALAAPPASAPPVPAPPEASTTRLTAEAPLPSASTAAPSPPPKTVAATPRGVASAPGPSRAAALPPPAKPSCDPPYYFDPKGARIFKKECL
jgi:serine/threonine protein kinase